MIMPSQALITPHLPNMKCRLFADFSFSFDIYTYSLYIITIYELLTIFSVIYHSTSYPYNCHLCCFSLYLLFLVFLDQYFVIFYYNII